MVMVVTVSAEVVVIVLVVVVVVVVAVIVEVIQFSCGSSTNGSSNNPGVILRTSCHSRRT